MRNNDYYIVYRYINGITNISLFPDPRNECTHVITTAIPGCIEHTKSPKSVVDVKRIQSITIRVF